MNTLNATKRSKADKLEIVRSNGMIPAVVYGARVENTLISVPSTDFAKIFKLAGETSAITIEVTDDKTSKPTKFDVLIHEIQFDPVKGNPIHVDFLAIDMNKTVEVEIPIEFTGIAGADKNGLGVLVKVLYEITIEALPKDIPHSVSVDLSKLETLEDQIRVGDIVLPKNIKLITDADEVVALVTPVKEEKEEAPIDLSAIEVEKKGKKDEEETATE